MIEQLLARKEVCICAGSGGVGKTTTAAAIGLGMAARGKKVAVLTIDPARRLANALGLPELGNEARRVEVDVSGELWAMMLDAKRTFDELIEARAPDEATRDAVLGNRIYQELSGALAGSQEYMAMEKLYELRQEGRYDLLVLDTPPTRSALEFLDAPGKLAAFIDSRSLRMFTAPGRLGVKALSRGTGFAFSAMRRATGMNLLEDLAEFFGSFGDMSQGFRERAERVNGLLADARTSFLLVTSARQDSIDEATYFRKRLIDGGLSFGGVVVNRVHEVEEGASTSGLSRWLGEPLADEIEANLTDHARLAARDRTNLERLRRSLRGKQLIQVPELDHDVHDIAGLQEVEGHLFAR